MTIENLEKTLQENIANGNLLLKNTTIESENIQFLFKEFFSDEPLNIKAVELKAESENITTKGQASLFAIPDLEIEIKFYLEDQKPQMRLIALLPNTWKFTQSFPSLGISILTQMGLKEEKFLFDQLTFEQPKLILDSVETKDPEQVSGIRFEAGLLVDYDLLPLNQLVNEIAPLKVTGLIVPTPKGTEVFLNTPIAGNINLGYLSVPSLELDLVADVIDEAEGSLSPYTSAYFALETQIKVGSSDNSVDLPIYSTFRGSHQDLTFEADLEDFSLTGLSQLTALLNGTALADLLPDGYRPEQGLVLSRLTLNVSSTEKKLESIAVYVTSKQPWKITDKIAIENVSVYFLVDNPTSSENRTLVCDLSGELSIDNLARFSVGASLPRFAMHGYMVQGGGLSLTRLINFFASDEVSVPQGFPDIIFSELGVTLDPKNRAFSLSGSALTDWEIIPKLVKLQQVETNFEVARIDGKTVVSGLILGTLMIAGAEVSLVADIEDQFVLRGKISKLNLSAILEEFFAMVELPTDLPDFEFANIEIAVTPKTGEFSLTGKSSNSWPIPIGVDGLEVEDISFQVLRSANSTQAEATTRQRSVTGFISGTLEVNTARFPITYQFPGDFVLQGHIPSLNLSPLVQRLCGSEVIRDLPIPASVLALSFSDVEVTIAPQKKSFSLAAGSSLGQTELIVKKIDNRWGFTAGFMPPSYWKFSEIADELRVLDGLKFSNTALILASSDDRNFALTRVQAQRSDVAIIRGLNFFAGMNLSGLGVDALLGITSLNVYTAISGKPADLVIEASIDGSFDLGKGVAFGDIRFRLKPAPSDFSLTLMGTVTAILNNSVLRFIGGMEVKPRSAEFQATMLGIWQDPFDAKGVSIANVAIELGMSFPPPLPTVGIAGTLQIGEFQGVVAVKFDSAMPSRSMLAIAFNRLYFMDVIGTFCGTAVKQAIPASLAKTVLDIGFENVKIYIVPQLTTIGELKFEQGTQLEGTMYFWGLRAYGYLKIDYLDGVEVKGDVEPINLAGIFKLTGATGKPKPSLYLKVSPKTVPNLDISGAVELLGIRSETQIRLSDSGFTFTTIGKIFDLFECTLEVRGQNLTQGGDFFIVATMRNDLLEYLRREASNAIKAAADEATRSLSNAQDAVASAQRNVDKLNTDINNMRQTIQRERDRDAQRMRDAQAAVASAQREVDKLNTDINNMRQTIQRERDRDSGRMRDAQGAVQRAQNDVNSLQGEIDNTKRRIEQLKQDISNKERWFNQSKWYEKSYRWAELSAYATAKGSEIAGLYTYIGGVEASKATANGVLEGAKQVVRGLEKTIVNFPIDADVRIAGLFTARETATGALSVATQTLQGLKVSIGSIADVGQFIVKYSLGGLLDVKSARFEATLMAARGGSVSLALTLVFMQGQPQTLALAFNFYDPLSGAKALAKQLLSA